VCVCVCVRVCVWVCVVCMCCVCAHEATGVVARSHMHVCDMTDSYVGHDSFICAT